MTDRFAEVKVVVSDVDGVLTSGDIILGPNGEEWKRFDSQDGAGIKYLIRAGIPMALITGRWSEAVLKRAAELGIGKVIVGAKEKLPALDEILGHFGLPAERTCYIGDDLPDIPVMRKVGCPVAVANARPEVKGLACYVTRAEGGRGAVREVIEQILKAQGLWPSILKRYGVSQCE